jgi:hypothetical protein
MAYLVRASLLPPLLLAAGLAGCGSSPATPTDAPAASPDGAPVGDAAPPDAFDPTCGGGRCAVHVVAGHLERDGQRWIPKGGVITGLVAPVAYLKGVYLDAHNAWGEGLVAALRATGADTVRFNVSMAAIDPQNSLGGTLDAAGKAAYVAEIQAAVALVEAHGMNAMVTMQTGDVAGDAAAEDVPGTQTARAWAVLAPRFAHDPAVLLIAFNEPGYGGAATIDSDPSPWLAWHAGFQQMVDAIRGAGATNVIVLDSLSTSRVWRKNSDGNLPIDPLGQLAYDLHPFPTDHTQLSNGGTGKPKLDYTTPADIDYWLDGWCDTHACVATAFFSGISNNADVGNCYDATPPGPAVTSPEIVRGFANHFQAKGVGVMVFAVDWKNRLFEDPATPTALTSFVGFTTCTGPKRMGAGAALQALWTTGTVPTPVP